MARRTGNWQQKGTKAPQLFLDVDFCLSSVPLRKSKSKEKRGQQGQERSIEEAIRGNFKRGTGDFPLTASAVFCKC